MGSTKKNHPKRKLRLRRPENPWKLVIFACIVLAVLGMAGYVYANTKRPPKPAERLVTIHDRGNERVILTRATTIRAALKTAKISVTPQDVVEPAIDSELLSTDLAVIIYRARPILVIDGTFRQKTVTAAVAPTEILNTVGAAPLAAVDNLSTRIGDPIADDGASKVYVVERGVNTPIKTVFVPNPRALTKSKGAQIFVDSHGVAHRETYYDLSMNVVINHCGAGNSYSVRAADGAKIDKDGYILVAANYRMYPRCSIVETSMGLGKVYDTGGFALRHPHGFDLATDWSRADGR